MTPQTARRLGEIAALLNAGQAARARSECEQLLKTSPGLTAAEYLLGGILEKLGDSNAAVTTLRRCVKAEPGNGRYWLSLGSSLRRAQQHAEAITSLQRATELLPLDPAAPWLLAHTLGDAGRYAEAEAACRESIARGRNDADAHALLGWLCAQQQHLPQAEAAYRTALQHNPRHAVATHNLGALLSQLERAEEALPLLQAALANTGGSFESHVNLGRALSQLGHLDKAEEAYTRAVAMRPADVEALVNLARLRFVRGAPDFADGFAQAGSQHPELTEVVCAWATALSYGGQPEQAIEVLQRAIKSGNSHPTIFKTLSDVQLELQHYGPAVDSARRAVAAGESHSAADALALALLSAGDGAQVMALATRMQQREPLMQNWIAYEASAARLMSNERYAQLYDYGRFVQVIDVPTPSGWSSAAEYHAALLRSLSTLHHMRRQPLDQSLRRGSQTMRSLLAEPDPIIRATLTALEDPIRSALAKIGSDPTHSFTRHNRGKVSMVGAWSVQLEAGGFHVNHLHPEGWLSGCFYVDVPADAADSSAKQGWLKMGEPRYPVPGATSDQQVQPAAGRLVLFPSYLWHGTIPFAHGSRTTIAFDAVPWDPQSAKR